MADKTPKPKTAKQEAQIAGLKDVAAKLKEAGLKGFAPNITYFQKEAAKGRPEAEILAEIKKRQNDRAANPVKRSTTPKKAAPAPSAVATKKNNNNAKSVASTGSTRSVARNAAAKRMKNTAALFKAQNVRWEGASMKHYFDQKSKGRSNDDIMKEMKQMFPAFKLTNEGEKVRVVAKRAVSVKKARPAGNANGGPAPSAPSAPSPVAPVKVVKGTAPKGTWVCEKCRLVANNTTRKNNKKNNAGPRGDPNAYMY